MHATHHTCNQYPEILCVACIQQANQLQPLPQPSAGGSPLTHELGRWKVIKLAGHVVAQGYECSCGVIGCGKAESGEALSAHPSAGGSQLRAWQPSRMALIERVVFNYCSHEDDGTGKCDCDKIVDELEQALAAQPPSEAPADHRCEFEMACTICGRALTESLRGKG